MNDAWFLILLFVVAAGASLLTFFSGFGLGTILLPVFALKFGVETAVLMTGIVHFENNILKIHLLRFNILWPLVFRFGIPSVIAAIGGVYVLRLLGEMDPWWGSVSPLKFILGALILIFTIMEWLPEFSVKPNKPNLFLGALISGFFGGLSGHQGALRSAFLLQLKLPKEIFIATGTAIACMVDLGRIPLYFRTEGAMNTLQEHASWLIIGLVGALLGAIAGNKLLKKITLKGVKIAVTIGMGLIGGGMMLGLI